jgi:hypothetical protein
MASDGAARQGNEKANMLLDQVESDHQYSYLLVYTFKPTVTSQSMLWGPFS